MTQDAIKKLVKDNTQSIVDQQTAKGIVAKWGQKEHHAMLRKCVVAISASEPNGEEFSNAVKVMLDEASAGNTSAYRQTLEKAKLITKAGSIEDDYK